MYYGIDSTYIIFVLPALLFAMFAQYKVNSTYKHFSGVYSHSGMTGADAARMILDNNGLSNVQIRYISGHLTDHYDPRTRVVNLSESVYGSTSIAAIGVAAHEVGHAIQHARDYKPMQIRSSIVRVTNIGSSLSMPLFLIGLLFNFDFLAVAGIVLFSLVAVFQLVTLPVEFNASGRALKTLEQYTILSDEEIKGTKRVLTAAAMTYVAALFTSLGQLFRLMALYGRNKD